MSNNNFFKKLLTTTSMIAALTAGVTNANAEVYDASGATLFPPYIEADGTLVYFTDHISNAAVNSGTKLKSGDIVVIPDGTVFASNPSIYSNIDFALRSISTKQNHVYIYSDFTLNAATRDLGGKTNSILTTADPGMSIDFYDAKTLSLVAEDNTQYVIPAESLNAYANDTASSVSFYKGDYSGINIIDFNNKNATLNLDSALLSGGGTNPAIKSTGGNNGTINVKGNSQIDMAIHNSIQSITLEEDATLITTNNLYALNVTLNENSTLELQNNTSTIINGFANDNGTLKLNGVAILHPDIGGTHRLNTLSVYKNAVINGAVNATNLKFAADATLHCTDAGAGTTFTSITTTDNNTGVFQLDGDYAPTIDIGATGQNLKLLDLRTQDLTITDGKNLHSNVRANSVTFNGASSFSGIIGADNDGKASGLFTNVNITGNNTKTVTMEDGEITGLTDISANGNFVITGKTNNITNSSGVANRGTVTLKAATVGNLGETLLGALSTISIDVGDSSCQTMHTSELKFIADGTLTVETDVFVPTTINTTTAGTGTLILKEDFTSVNNMTLKNITLGTGDTDAPTLTLDHTMSGSITGTKAAELIISNNQNVYGIGSEGSPIHSVTSLLGSTFKNDVYAEIITLTAGNSTFEGVVGAETIVVPHATAQNITFNKNVTSDISIANGAHTLTFAANVNYTGDITPAAAIGVVTFSGANSLNGNIGNNATNITTLNINGGKSDTFNLKGEIYAATANYTTGTILELSGDSKIATATNCNITGGTLNLNNNVLEIGSATSTVTFGNGNSTTNITIKDKDHNGLLIVNANAFTIDPSAKFTFILDDTAVTLAGSDNINLVSFNNAGTYPNLSATDLKTLIDNSTVTGSDTSSKIADTYTLKSKELDTTAHTGLVLYAEVVNNVSDFQNAITPLLTSSNSNSLKTVLTDFSKMDISTDSTFGKFIHNFITGSTISNEEAATRWEKAATAPDVSSAIGTGVKLNASAINARMAAAAAGDDSMKMGAWVSGFGNSSTQKARKDDAGYKSTAFGFSLGADTEINDYVTLGIAGSLSKTNSKMKDQLSGDKVTSQTYSGSLYANYKFADDWMINVIASFGRSDIKNSNKTTGTGNDRATAKFKPTHYAGQATLGYKYDLSSFAITPMAGLEYVHYNKATATETGSIYRNRKITIKALDKMNALFGAMVSTQYDVEGTNVVPEFHAFGSYDFKGKAPSADIRIDGYNKSFASSQAKPARLSYDLGVSLTAKSSSLEYGVGYDANLSNKYISHQGSLKIRVNF